MNTAVRKLHSKKDPYPVLLGHNLIDNLGLKLNQLWGNRRLAVVTQARVNRIHGERLRISLLKANINTFTLRIPEGEDKKNLVTIQRLYEQLVSKKFSRDDAILAFGGGTVGDVAGFVAATFLRGVRYTQVPTTLLAQIDSSIGSKVGVNLPNGKNLVGSIYRPNAVWIDPSLLNSLSAREMNSGMFELLKYGFIGVPALLNRFSKKTPQLNSSLLYRSISDGIRVKLEVVRKDERENGLRRILNFGHTIGHGLEVASKYSLLRHGEAVGWGMIGAVRLAEHRSTLNAMDVKRLESTIRKVGPLPKLGQISLRKIMAGIQNDKKQSSTGLRFILPVGWGKVDIIPNFPEEEIAWAIKTLGVGR